MNDSTNAKSTVTIKKYANRRLYNTATSSYVTLEDLSAMVKEGVEFNVYDAKTSEDITRSVLTQIIVEEEGKSGQQNLLPIGFLRQLISFYGDNMQWMVPKYLDHSMQMLSQNQEQIKNYFQSTFGGIFPFGSTFEEMGKQNLAMFERTMNMFTKLPTTSTSTDASGEATTSSTNSDAANNPMWNLANCFMNACSSNIPAMPSTMPFGLTTPQNNTNTNSETKTAATSNTTTTAAADAKNTAPTAKTATTTNTSTNAKDATATDNVTNLSAVTSSSPAMPMTNVKNATTATSTAAADDMQQKIANLQRQLADLAKNRA